MSAPLVAPARVCGWCGLELAPGTLPASHGICPACYVRLELEPTAPKEPLAVRLTFAEFLRRILRRQHGYRWLASVIRRDPCSYCAAAGGTAEHVRPRLHGGPNHHQNRAGACRACNHARGSYRLLRFLLCRHAAEQTQRRDAGARLTAARSA